MHGRDPGKIAEGENINMMVYINRTKKVMQSGAAPRGAGTSQIGNQLGHNTGKTCRERSCNRGPDMSTGHPTPVYSHAGRGRFQDVYEPAEDSFLLMDALEKDAQRLQLMSPCVCLEVGSGSGAVSAFLASVVDCLLPRLSGKVDVLLFNPPYVVTPSEEVGSRGIEAAWAGGKRGREVTDRFLPLVSQLLSSNGLFYLITIAENDPEEIIKFLGNCDLKGEQCLSARAGNERLSVLRFHRSQL
ncbi:hypothetical protein F2P81_002441 [Scophthalmus maximus]|uniref:Methyltransferase HEMK2 n=1 Tax=Scophthalmus maximus TaxID=52904 RepID=A0A6A4TV70_SCOMX|nr:hypothetical protein F2P81_002441 [Scophthalmus maximus]